MDAKDPMSTSHSSGSKAFSKIYGKMELSKPKAAVLFSSKISNRQLEFRDCGYWR